MDVTERANITKVIAQVLIADAVLGDAERGHLDALMQDLGMDAAEQKAALHGIDLDSPVEKWIEGLSAEAKARLASALDDAVAIATDDGSESPIVARVRALVS